MSSKKSILRAENHSHLLSKELENHSLTLFKEAVIINFDEAISEFSFQADATPLQATSPNRSRQKRRKLMCSSGGPVSPRPKEFVSPKTMVKCLDFNTCSPRVDLNVCFDGPSDTCPNRPKESSSTFKFEVLPTS